MAKVIRGVTEDVIGARTDVFTRENDLGLTLGEVPLLSSLSSDAVRSFLRKYETFKRAGLKRPLDHMILVPVKELLAIRLDLTDEQFDALKDNELEAYLLKLYAPKSKLEALQMVQGIKMRQTERIDLNAASAYVLTWKRALKQFEGSNRPPPKELTKTFLKGLQPAVLRERCRLEVPADIDAAIRNVLKAADELFGYQRQLGINPDKKPKPKDLPAGGQEKEQKDDDQRPSRRERRKNKKAKEAKSEDAPAAAAAGPPKEKTPGFVPTCNHCGKPGRTTGKKLHYR